MTLSGRSNEKIIENRNKKIHETLFLNNYFALCCYFAIVNRFSNQEVESILERSCFLFFGEERTTRKKTIFL